MLHEPQMLCVRAACVLRERCVLRAAWMRRVSRPFLHVKQMTSPSASSFYLCVNFEEGRLALIDDVVHLYQTIIELNLEVLILSQF